MSNPGSAAATAAAATSGGGGGPSRAARLPRWTRQEILVLIQGKRVVEGRGRTRGGGAAPLEPKWAAVAAYCRRHGVDRGPVQCRKRWSNLTGDYKKIKDWERGKGRAAAESFWVMRNDVRREQRLPGFFDREVYDILDGAAVVALEAAPEKEEEAVFDSGRTAAEDGLFSDGDDDKDAAAAEEEDEDDEERTPPPPPLQPLPPPPPPPPAAVAAAAPPISEKKIEQILARPSDHPGMAKDKHPAENPAKGSPSEKGSPSVEGHKRRRTSEEETGEGHKRRRASEEETGDTILQSQLIEVLDRNSKVLASHLEAQNVNCQLDREQRKEQADSLLGVLGKLADAIGRIADKL